ncbi:MAG: hypothetical protein DSM107014_16115, partial [Gomphosphaeria aponina SAG 52.96 = DSM 107014]|nr:hypothetical protein [Gomphosphaeria aponina SAG 52.96 = DSM 107014]
SQPVDDFAALLNEEIESEAVEESQPVDDFAALLNEEIESEAVEESPSVDDFAALLNEEIESEAVEESPSVDDFEAFLNEEIESEQINLEDLGIGANDFTEMIETEEVSVESATEQPKLQKSPVDDFAAMFQEEAETEQSSFNDLDFSADDVTEMIESEEDWNATNEQSGLEESQVNEFEELMNFELESSEEPNLAASQLEINPFLDEQENSSGDFDDFAELLQADFPDESPSTSENAEYNLDDLDDLFDFEEDDQTQPKNKK